MSYKVKISRTLRAAGTVMDVWPTGDYSEYMPKGKPQQRIGRHWDNTGSHLEKALRQYGQRPAQS